MRLVSEKKQQLMLIPGSLCDERVWQNQSRDLVDIADITVPHLHGFGSLSAMAKAIVDNAPKQFALCGFSMGGRVAMEVFRLAPNRITHLALVDASVHPVGAGEAPRRQPQIDMAHDKGMAALADWWNPKIAHPSRHSDPAYMDLLRDMACTFSADDYEQEVSALLNRPDPRDLMATITIPTLILAGREDPLSTPERNQAMAEQVSGSTLKLIDDAAHFPMLEKPEEVTAALREWLGS